MVAAGLGGAVPHASAVPLTPAAAAAASARAALARAQAQTVPAAEAGMSSRSGAVVRAHAAALASGQPAEITADRTPFSQTFANPDGSFTTTASVQPRWVKSGSSWVAADATLAQQADGSYAPKAALGGLSLSGGGSTVLATARAGGRWLQVSWPQALPAPAVSGATATYPDVFPGVDLAVTAELAGGFSETLVIKDKTAAADPQLTGLTLGVTASPGLAAHPGAGGSLGESTASGQTVFYSPPPMAWDSSAPGASAAGPGAPGAGLVPAPASYAAGSVKLGIPASLLAEPAADFPVYVDPSYTETPWWQNYGEIQSAYPTTNELGATYDGNVSVGYDGGGIDRGDYVFGLPAAATTAAVNITSATMTATADKTFTSASTSHTVNASYVTQYTSASTWNSPPALIAGPSAQTFTTTSTTPNQNVSWNVASWLQSAYNGSAFQMTVQLANADETDSGPFVEFGANPTLNFTYTQPAPSVPLGTGPVPNATLLHFPISDKASLAVNVGSGNALFTTSDLTLPELSGNLTLGADYNSLLVPSAINNGADRNGWRQRQGQDVRLYLSPDGSTVTYAGVNGVAGMFTSPSGGVYASPAIFHATLSYNPIANPGLCPAADYELLWHSSGRVMCFNADGLLVSQADRNKNTTAFSYNGDGQETQVAYTPTGASSPTETVTVSWTGNDLTVLSESGGSTGTKNVSYGINGSGDLTTVQQPDSTTLTLGYDGSHHLTSVQNGAGKTTTIGYNSSGQVTSVTQPYGSGSATATTRFSYVSATETQVASPDTDQGQPVSAVPNTTYTVNSQDLVTRAVNPVGDSPSATYNSTTNNVATTNSGITGVSNTTYNWDTSNPERLSSTAFPDGDVTKTTTWNSSTTPNPTGKYQPDNSVDAQSNTSNYGYDPSGNLTSATSALAADASVTLNTSPADGQPAHSNDPGGGVTAYAYEPATRRLATVTPQTPLTAISITYDGFGRVATVTDGNSNTLTYTYDLADRITKQAWTGGPRTLTVTYAYDGAGNLHIQTDASGTTTWTYDGRNQALTKNAASGGGTLSWSYDADGNMLTSADGAGTTHDTYDTADELASLTDPTGTLWQFGYDKAGRRTETWFATNSGNTSYAAQDHRWFSNDGMTTKIQQTSSSGTSFNYRTYGYVINTSDGCLHEPNTGTTAQLVQLSKDENSGIQSVYCYDYGNRLVKIQPASGTVYSFTYDGSSSQTNTSARGNLTAGAPAGNLGYNTANEITTSGWGYDHDGNLTADPANGTLAYNDAGQLISASAASGGGAGSAAETFTYAGGGQDQPLSDGSATNITYGLADPSGEPAVDSYTTGGGTSYVIRDPQGDPLGMIRGGKAYIYLTDNLGSVITLIGTDGANDGAYAYTPYGTLSAKSAGSGGSLVTQNLIGYTGELTDTFTAGSTGYIHDGTRWYNPRAGSFTTQDANSYLASPTNGNRFAYAGDNPANNTDPTGFWALNLGLSGCAVVCIEGVISVGSGGISFTGGLGAGPAGGIDASLTESSGDGTANGVAAEVECEAFLTGGFNSSGEVSAGVTTATEAGCETYVTESSTIYRW